MSDYRRQYEDRLPALEQAVKEMPGDIDDVVPGMSRAGLQRFFRRYAVQLGRLDKKGAKHPQYLFVKGRYAPDLLLENIDTAIQNLGSGAATFVQNSLTLLVSIQDAIERAIGVDVDEVRSLASSVAADLASAVARTDELASTAQESADALTATEQQARRVRTEAQSLLEQIGSDAAKATDARQKLEQIVNPDGRSRTSLESLARRARERITEIDEALAISQANATNATDAARVSGEQRQQAEEELTKLRALQTEAQQILNLSSQAGLAASYQKESSRLNARSMIYNGILYAVSAATLYIAVYYVLPELGKVVDKVGDHFSFWQALSLALLRIVALAPLIYVIFFTTRRISDIELLRMDYAEKAAASLAYSGYKEQMNVDSDLLRQLKASLLIKFNEHPERLLRPGVNTSRAKIVTPGFEAETEFRNFGRNGKTDPDSDGGNAAE